jgi:hypothetical protein
MAEHYSKSVVRRSIHQLLTFCVRATIFFCIHPVLFLFPWPTLPTHRILQICYNILDPLGTIVPVYFYYHSIKSNTYSLFHSIFKLKLNNTNLLIYIVINFINCILIIIIIFYSLILINFIIQ